MNATHISGSLHRLQQGTSPNGPTAIGQNQMGASGMEVTTAVNSVDKGGMRGAGLIAMTIAEVALKKEASDLAEDYYNTNRKDYDFFKNLHRTPMQQTALEAFGPRNPKYNYDYYASVPAGIAKSAVIDRQWFEARRRMPKYNIGQMRRLDYDMAIARTHAVVAGWNLAVRYETSWADARNKRAFDKKLTSANMGIGVGNITTGLANSVGKLATAYDQVGDTIASIGNGYAANRGYFAGRENTRQRYENQAGNE